LNAENDKLARETAINLEAARAKIDNQRNEIRNLQKALQQAKRQIANKPTRALSPRITEKPKKKRSRQPPPVRVVSGGLPGHGRRR
jgi:multidrug resistance efflux pump